jgi:integrase
MPLTPSPRIPSYCIHSGKNLAYVRLNGSPVYLGKPNSPESRERYDRAIAEWMQAGRVYVPPADRQGISVNEVLLAYRRHAATIYVNPDGTPTGELCRINLSLRPVTELYGTAPAVTFGPKALAAVRSKIVDTGVKRSTINDRVDAIRRVFKWAAGEELIPADIYHALKTVDGLRRGRTAAPESEPVKPVADHIVTAVLKHCPPTLAAMIRLHDLTGMRSGELTIMRGIDIEFGTDGQPWFYRPVKHKTQNHGHKRLVAIGPAAQDVLRPYLTTDVQAFIFSPQRARDERNTAKRAARKTPVQPSQLNRRKAHPTRPPGTRYTTPSYARAILWATRLAIKAGDLPEGTHWHPHQLRHNTATRIRREFGSLDAVRAFLGHTSVSQSAEYAELDAGLAAKVAAKLG